MPAPCPYQLFFTAFSRFYFRLIYLLIHCVDAYISPLYGHYKWMIRGYIKSDLFAEMLRSWANNFKSSDPSFCFSDWRGEWSDDLKSSDHKRRQIRRWPRINYVVTSAYSRVIFQGLPASISCILYELRNAIAWFYLEKRRPSRDWAGRFIASVCLRIHSLLLKLYSEKRIY